MVKNIVEDNKKVNSPTYESYWQREQEQIWSSLDFQLMKECLQN